MGVEPSRLSGRGGQVELGVAENMGLAEAERCMLYPGCGLHSHVAPKRAGKVCPDGHQAMVAQMTALRSPKTLTMASPNSVLLLPMNGMTPTGPRE